MDKKFELSSRELLDNLFNIQIEMGQIQNEDNYTFYRLLELDMYKLLETLKIYPCEFCQYPLMNKDKKCDLEVRCQSYMLIKKIIHSGDDLTAKLEFILKLI